MNSEQNVQPLDEGGNAAKPIVRRRVSVGLTLEEIEHLIEFIDGSLGCADSDEFIEWASKVSSKLKLTVAKHGG